MKEKRLSRRHFLRLSAGAVTGIMAAACVPATPPSQVAPATQEMPAKEQVKQKVKWMGPFVPPYRFQWIQETLINKMFKEAYPNIEVELEQTSSWLDTEEKVLVRWAAGGGPDLLQMGETGAVTEFAWRGMLAPLNPFIEQDPNIYPELFFTTPLKAGQFEGKTYALPHDSMTEVFFYNKKHLEQAGISNPPQTLEDVAEYAKALTELDGVDFGLQVNLSGWNTFTCYLYANGGDFLDEGCTRPLFNNDIGVETLTYLIELVEAGYATPHGVEASLANGKASMMDSVPWIVGWTKNYAPEIYEVLGATLMPAGKGGHTTWGWAHYEGILQNSKNKEGAWVFLSWMLGDEDVDLAYHENLNFLPAQPRTFAKPPFSEHFAWTVFAQQLEHTRTMPLCVKWREINTDALIPTLEAAWIGEKSPQEALDAAAKRAQEILQG